MQKKIILLGILLLYIPFAVAGTIVYDDFSGLVLDQIKWAIEHASLEAASSTFLDKTSLDITTHRFHLAQIQPRDAATVLSSTRSFQVGESIELDIYYISGSGNREIKPVVNNIPLDLRMGSDGYNCGGCPTSGDIGYWNGVSEVGNQFGMWHLTVQFLTDNHAKIIFKRPDGTMFQYTTTQVTYPVKFGMEALTGNDGTINADYDNFMLTSPSITETPPPNQLNENLSAEIVNLQNRTANLSIQLSILDSLLTGQSELINQLKTDVNTLKTQNIDELKLQIQQLQTQSTNLSSRLTDVEQQNISITNLFFQTYQLQQQIANLTNRLALSEQQAMNWQAVNSTLNSAVIELNNVTARIDLIETSIGLHDAELKDLRQTILALNNQFNQKQALNEQKIDELTARIQTLEQRINNTYTKPEVDTKINALTTTIKSLETRIKILEKQVKEIITKISQVGWWRKILFP